MCAKKPGKLLYVPSQPFSLFITPSIQNTQKEVITDLSTSGTFDPRDPSLPLNEKFIIMTDVTITPRRPTVAMKFHQPK
jgi:hypothetical protein